METGHIANSSGSGTPRWVKLSVLIAVVVVLMVVLLLSGGLGEHGPGRHASSGDPLSGQAWSVSAA